MNLAAQESTISVSKLRTGKEKMYLTIVIFFSFFIWIWIFFSVFRQIQEFIYPSTRESSCYVKDQFNEQVTKINRKYLIAGEECIPEEKLSSLFTTPLILLLLFPLTIFLHLLSIAYVRKNAVKIGPEQFPEFWQAVQTISNNIGMEKSPDLFVMQSDGLINAFAMRLVFRRIIVITSSLAETLIEQNNQKQIEAVIAHELGHHALAHTANWNWLLLFSEYVPLLYPALSRAREYSADRVMQAVSRNLNDTERALIKLAGGKLVGSKANIEIYLKQSFEEQGFFSWLAEKVATHPHLPHRIQAIRRLQQKIQSEE